MTFEKAIKQLRLQKFKLERQGVTPPFMADWTENQISSYYEKQKDTCEAIDFAIKVLKGARNFRLATDQFVSIFDEMDAETDPKKDGGGIVAHT